MYEKLISRLMSLSEIKAIQQEPGICRITMECIGAIKEIAIEAADAIKELKRDLDLAIRAEAAATEACKPHWIPVTERLPQEREWVLCQCRAKIRMVLRLQNGYWHQDSRHEFMSGFVTHWMPLPEPLKGEA